MVGFQRGYAIDNRKRLTCTTMGRPRRFEDPVEFTIRLERELRDRLKRHIHGRLEMNATIERAVVEFLDREERATLINDPKRNLSW